MIKSDFLATIHDTYKTLGYMKTRSEDQQSSPSNQQVKRSKRVRIGPLADLPALVNELGVDPDHVFATHGFDVSYFQDADNEISFLGGSELLAGCVSDTACEHLGLLLGKRADPSCLGLAGFILKAAPDVGAALRNLVQHLDLHDQGGSAYITVNGELTLFGYSIDIPGAKAADQIYDLSLTLACRIMRNLCGKDWHPTQVLLTRKAPRHRTPYRNYFQAPITFAAEQNALVFPTYWLNHPNPAADPLLYRYLEREAAEQHAFRQMDMGDRVRRLLRKSLAMQKTSANDVANQLGMHERTLNRRLREENTTFRKELDKVRYDLSRQLLTETDQSLSQIASTLNYAEVTTFSRAFKRWTGQTPNAWRAGRRK